MMSYKEKGVLAFNQFIVFNQEMDLYSISCSIKYRIEQNNLEERHILLLQGILEEIESRNIKI